VFQEVDAARISGQSAREGGKDVSRTHRPLLPPREYPLFSFLLEAESTPGPQYGPRDYVNENKSEMITVTRSIRMKRERKREGGAVPITEMIKCIQMFGVSHQTMACSCTAQ
jgi:hypothetical protein